MRINVDFFLVIWHERGDVLNACTDSFLGPIFDNQTPTLLFSNLTAC